MGEAGIAQRHFVRSGAVAGMVAAVGFVVIHDLLISDIWEMLIIMMAAGAICGLCIGWTYGRLFSTPSVRSWVRYNAVYLAMFAGLGAVSLLLFEPITTVAAINEAGGPVDELIVAALPMTVAFTFITAGLLSLLFGLSWAHFGATLITVTVLVLFLGLNVSVIGLVEFNSGSVYLIAEVFGLIVVLNMGFVSTFVALEWRGLATDVMI